MVEDNNLLANARKTVCIDKHVFQPCSSFKVVRSTAGGAETEGWRADGCSEHAHLEGRCVLMWKRSFLPFWIWECKHRDAKQHDFLLGSIGLGVKQPFHVFETERH